MISDGGRCSSFIPSLSSNESLPLNCRTMINGKRMDKKIIYSPLQQRLKSSLVKLTYFMTVFNLIIFIYLVISSTQTVHYDIEVPGNSCLSSNHSISFWDNTSFGLGGQCIASIFSEEVKFNFMDETDRLKRCQVDSLNYFWRPPNDFFTFLPMKLYPSSNKKIVSFSLYGGADRYLRNVIKIIRRYKKLLPDWIPRFWLGSDVPFLMLNRLMFEEVEVIIVHQRNPNANVTRSPHFHGMFWRFFASDDEHVERFIVRDSDSMLIQREVDAMNQWISENTAFHVMRDHPQHAIEILGGMWGGKVNKKVFSASREYAKALKKGFDSKDNKGLDQEFLQLYLWPIARTQMTCHTAYRWKSVDSRGCKDFPTKREGTSFIGSVMED